MDKLFLQSKLQFEEFLSIKQALIKPNKGQYLNLTPSPLKNIYFFLFYN